MNTPNPPGGALDSFRYNFLYFIDYNFYIVNHFIISKSDDFDTIFFDFSFPAIILLNLLFMNLTINFNY
jgi:hypothetical protein